MSLKVEERHITGLEKIYQKSRKVANKGMVTALDETKDFVDQVRKEYEDAEAKNKVASTVKQEVEEGSSKQLTPETSEGQP